MIEKVLEAYEARVAGEKTFMQKLEQMDKITKMVFWGIIFSAFVILVLTFLVRSQVMLFVMITYGAIIYIY